EYLPQYPRHAIRDVRLLHLEAEHDDAAWVQQRPGLLDALARVDVVIQPGVGHGRRRVRIEQPEGDDVEPLGAGGEERAGVVVDQPNRWRRVWLFRMIARAHVEDGRVDLDRDDLGYALAQGAGGVVARTGTDDEQFPWLCMQAGREVVLAEAAHLRRM